jgi:hypothetical protein
MSTPRRASNGAGVPLPLGVAKAHAAPVGTPSLGVATREGEQDAKRVVRRQEQLCAPTPTISGGAARDSFRPHIEDIQRQRRNP